MNKSKMLTTSVETFEPSRLTLTDFQDNEKTRGQKIAFLRYNHPSLGEETMLMLQTPWITLTSGGVPKPNTDYYPTDRQRAFMRLPIEEGSTFFKAMTQLDEQFTSDKFKQEKFGKNWKKFSMFPIVKIPEHDEDDDREPLPPSMKIKFDLVWDTNNSDGCEIKTQIYLSKVDENGKRERTLFDKNSLEDVESILRLGSKVRSIIRPVKAWQNGKKEYGVTWKVIKMEVEPAKNSNSLMKAYYEADAFLDSDDEEEEIDVPQKMEKKKPSMVNDSEDESEDEDESDDEDESEDESDDEDSPDIPVKKTRGKKTKNVSL